MINDVFGKLEIGGEAARIATLIMEDEKVMTLVSLLNIFITLFSMAFFKWFNDDSDLGQESLFKTSQERVWEI